MKVKVKVVPGAKHERLIETEEGIKVYLTEPAQEGRANKRLIEVIAAYYHRKRRQITIVKGHQKRQKIVDIREAD